MNSGKKFEKSFKDSFPKDVYIERMSDPAQSFYQGDGLRFSPTNPYDYFFFSCPNLVTIELKSKDSTSLTFWRQDFEVKDKKQSFEIKKCQIEGLHKASQYKGVIAGFVINFRNVNHTYFLHINDFLNLTSTLDKKSINEQNIVTSNGLLIEQTLLRTNYTYNIQKFITNIKERFA
jgi:recombination protein U